MGFQRVTERPARWIRRGLPDGTAALTERGELLLHRSDAQTLRLGGVALVEPDAERRTLTVRSPSGGPWDAPHRLVMVRWHKGRVVLQVYKALADLGIRPDKAAGKYRLRVGERFVIVDFKLPPVQTAPRPVDNVR